MSGNPSPETLSKALQLYSDVRHDRAARVQVTSAEAGLLYEGRGVGGEGQDISKVKPNLDDRMRWVRRRRRRKPVISIPLLALIPPVSRQAHQLTVLIYCSCIACFPLRSPSRTAPRRAPRWIWEYDTKGAADDMLRRAEAL